MSTLTAEVAQRIVDRTMAVIGRNVNVMDDRGLILATGDPGRRRQQHEGALVAAQSDRVVVIDAAEARLLHGVQPGVNLPLHHRGEVVGVIGISGDPEEVRVLADLIRVAAELIVEQAGVLESGHLRRQEREDHLIAVVEDRLDPRSVARRAVDLDITLDVRRCCTVVRPVVMAAPRAEHADGGAGVEALRALQRRLGARADLLVARTRRDELAVWWPTDDPVAREEVRRSVLEAGGVLVAGEGEAFGGEQGLRRAWVTARDALAVSRLSADLYERRDLPLVALLCELRDDWRAEVLSGPWRALIAADRHGELRTTLRAWIEHDLHPGRCADALHVHRNTLRGRLERIERVTGLELRRVPSLVQLYLGPLLAAGDPSAREVGTDPP